MAEVVSSAEVLCSWLVPSTGLGPVQVVAHAGAVTTIVGANGSGKSALGTWMQQQASGAPTRRLIAHRRLWFEHAGPEISSAQREQTEKNRSYWNTLPESRYLDHADSQRASIVLFDFLAMMNSQNIELIDLFRSGLTSEEVEKAAGVQLLERLNRILRASGLWVGIQVAEGQAFDAVNSRTGAQYPIFKMSDGEKSALLLAAEVLTAPHGTVLIIDEPERHLHRSISANLVEAVVRERPDCHFIVFTHDLDLAAILDEQAGSTFSVTGCTWSGEIPSNWDIFRVESGAEISDDARRAILGGRRDVLFIEGSHESVDLQLYRLIFTDQTLFPVGSADQVIRAVAGLRASESHHWIRASGVVDGDERTPLERKSLIDRGVLPLPVSEVENLYYLREVVEAVAQQQAYSLGGDVAALVAAAHVRALEAVSEKPTLERLARKLALSAIRRRVVEELPVKLYGDTRQVDISVESPYRTILSELEDECSKGNLEALIRRLPIRDTSMRDRVATVLGFRSTADYEAAARVQIRDCTPLAAALRSLVGPLPAGGGAP